MWNAKRNLSQKRIIKNIVLMSVAELLQTKESWTSITKEKQLRMAQLGHAKNAKLSLVGTINLFYVLLVKRRLM
jgi:hypothetical protein